ncbi:MAG: hypothetical protein JO131_06080 [Gammaproteobacteria bacterium]|nr:hypothetical protein [Gammaproteobacteria bacterium]
MSKTRPPQDEKPHQDELNRYLNENIKIFQGFFAKLASDEKIKFTAVTKSLNDLFEDEVNKIFKFGKEKYFPSVLVNFKLAPYLMINELADLSQVNRFFQRTLKKPLQEVKLRKEQQLKSDIEQLIEKYQCNKNSNEITSWLAKCFNISITELNPFLSKLVFFHYFELTHSKPYDFYLNNLKSSTFSISQYREPTIQFSYENGKLNYQSRKFIDGTSENTDFSRYIKVYNQHYAEINAEHCFISSCYTNYSQHTFSIYFNLYGFLRSLIPVFMGLTEKPMASTINNKRK